MVDRYRSKALELPSAEHTIDRVDLAFYGVDHSSATYEARVFVGAPRSLKSDPGPDHPAYAGSFYVFGHDRCYGDSGHCRVPEERDPFDFRLPHHLEPETEIVTITPAVERLLAAGRESAVVDVFALDPDGKPTQALEFTQLRLLTYR